MSTTNNEVIVTSTAVEGMSAFEDMHEGISSVLALFQTVTLFADKDEVEVFSPFLYKTKKSPTTEFEWVLSFVDPGDTTRRAVFTFSKHYAPAQTTGAPNGDK